MESFCQRFVAHWSLISKMLWSYYLNEFVALEKVSEAANAPFFFLEALALTKAKKICDILHSIYNLLYLCGIYYQYNVVLIAFITCFFLCDQLGYRTEATNASSRDIFIQILQYLRVTNIAKALLHCTPAKPLSLWGSRVR